MFIFKRCLSLLLCCLLLLPLLAGVSMAADSPFVDVSAKDYYCEAVHWGVQHDPQITAGVTATAFRPHDVCSRAQAVTFLWRAMGCPKPGDQKNPFEDVKSDAYYFKAVLWAVEKGITVGTAENAFSPNQGCTRAQMVTFLWRTLITPAVQRQNPFVDVDSGSYAFNAILWAVDAGITVGADTTHFRPDGVCERAHMITFLYRAREWFAKAAQDAQTLPLLVPQIRIITRTGSGTTLQKEDGYITADITITDTDGTCQTGQVQLKVRGHSTARTNVEKKAYNIKFGQKRELLGLGKGKKWALLANAFDPTLLRNAMANHLAHELGLPYTSNRRYVELWLDGSFRGCYDLFVPVQVNKDRINLDLEGNEGKKDFLLEVEALRYESDVRYFTVGGVRFAISEPEEPSVMQQKYIADTMQSILYILSVGSREQIEQIIDVPSFAKYYLLNEFLKTHDFGFSSVFYFYKDGKLYAGPAWDYDLSAGNSNPDLDDHGAATASPEGLYANGCNLYPLLTGKDWFQAEVKSQYQQYADYLRSICADGGLLDTMRQTYEPIFKRNYDTAGWSIRTWYIAGQKKPLRTYEENYQFLKDWLSQRNAFFEQYFGG